MLISFEGIDGSGKSTQIRLFSEKLEADGVPYRVFREPGGTELSEEIRNILLHHKGEMDPVAELLLFSAARAQLIAGEVKPLLTQGRVVILDRFYDSTTAYQGYARRALAASDIEKINRIAAHELVPDLTFYLRLEAQQAASRISADKDRMEQGGLDFYRKVQQGYDEIARKESRFCIIPADMPVEDVQNQIWQVYRKMTEG